MRCDSEFKGGQFTQKLRCVRMPGQPIDYGGKLPEGSKATLQKKVGNEQKVKTEVGESAPPAKVDRTITIEEVEKAGEQFANNVLAKFGLNLDSIDKFAAKLPKGDGNFKSTPKKPKLIEKRRQSNGTLVNFNIDRTKPFTDSKDSEGNTIRIFDPKILDGVKT